MSVGANTQTASEGRPRRSRRGNVRGMEVPRTGCAQPMSASDSTPRTGQNGDGAQLLEREAAAMFSSHLGLIRDQAVEVEERSDSLDERIETVRSMRAQLQLVEAMLVEARDDQEGSS